MLINADIMRGAFLGIEYAYAIANPNDVLDSIAVFDNDIERMCDAYIDDAKDNIFDDYLFIVAPHLVFKSVSDEIACAIEDEMMNAIQNDEFIALLANTYTIAINTTKGV